MPDNVGYTPGTGATIAADDIGGNLFQRVKLIHGADGVNDGDVSALNGLPVQGVGELMEAIEAMRVAIQSLTRTIGMALPSAAGWPIMEVRQPLASNLLVNAGQSGTWNVGTVTTVTNQSQVGGFSAIEQIPALMKLQADNLRNNISVT
jgi:hypothetical protein